MAQLTDVTSDGGTTLDGSFNFVQFDTTEFDVTSFVQTLFGDGVGHAGFRFSAASVPTSITTSARIWQRPKLTIAYDVQAVPLPPAAWMGLGMLGLLGLRRKLKRRTA